MYFVRSDAQRVKISSIVLLRRRDWLGGLGPLVELVAPSTEAVLAAPTFEVDVAAGAVAAVLAEVAAVVVVAVVAAVAVGFVGSEVVARLAPGAGLAGALNKPSKGAVVVATCAADEEGVCDVAEGGTGAARAALVPPPPLTDVLVDCPNDPRDEGVVDGACELLVAPKSDDGFAVSDVLAVVAEGCACDLVAEPNREAGFTVSDVLG